MDNRSISKSNQRLTWIRNGMWAIATSLQAASVLQALFLKLGITTEHIAIYFSVMQIVSLASTFLTTSLPRYITNTKKGDAIATVLSGLLFLGNVIICLFAGIPLNIKWVILLVVGCFVNMFLAIRTVFDYKLPCELIIMSDYSFFTAVDGIVQGLCSIPIAFLMPIMYSKFNYEDVTAIAFSISVILMFITSIITMSFRKLDVTVKENTSDDKTSILPLNDIRNLLHNKEFMFLAIPNIIRGFSAGIYTLIPTLAISSGCFTEINVMLITGTGQAAVFVSCLFYAWIGKKYGTRSMTVPLLGLVAGVLGLALIPVMKLSVIPFLCCYFVAYGGFNIMSYAVPDMVYKSVDSDIISPFHTWRMGLTTLGNVVATYAIGLFAESISATVFMIIGAVSMLFCCFGYYLWFKKNPIIL